MNDKHFRVIFLRSIFIIYLENSLPNKGKLKTKTPPGRQPVMEINYDK